MELQQVKKGRTNTITIITSDTIDKIAKVKMFDDAEMNSKLCELHKELLNTSMKKNDSYEVGIFWNLCNLKEIYKIRGNRNGISLSDDKIIMNFIKTAPMYSIVVMHNHPRNGLFSGKDLKSFADYNSIYAMTAVCNDGTIYMIEKMSDFSSLALMEYYKEGIEKGGEYAGIKNVARNAHKIGIIYRCSVKRRR